MAIGGTCAVGFFESGGTLATPAVAGSRARPVRRDGFRPVLRLPDGNGSHFGPFGGTVAGRPIDLPSIRPGKALYR